MIRKSRNELVVEMLIMNGRIRYDIYLRVRVRARIEVFLLILITLYYFVFQSISSSEESSLWVN